MARAQFPIERPFAHGLAAAGEQYQADPQMASEALNLSLDAKGNATERPLWRYGGTLFFGVTPMCILYNVVNGTAPALYVLSIEGGNGSKGAPDANGRVLPQSLGFPGIFAAAPTAQLKQDGVTPYNSWLWCPVTTGGGFYGLGVDGKIYTTDSAGAVVTTTITRSAVNHVANDLLFAYGRLWAICDATPGAGSLLISSVTNSLDFSTGTSASLLLANVGTPSPAGWPVAVAGWRKKIIIFFSDRIVAYGPTDVGQSFSGVGAGLTGDPGLAQTDEILGIGCVSAASVVQVEGDLMFMSPRGLMSLARVLQTSDMDLSAVIPHMQPDFEAIGRAAAQRGSLYTTSAAGHLGNPRYTGLTSYYDASRSTLYMVYREGVGAVSGNGSPLFDQCYAIVFKRGVNVPPAVFQWTGNSTVSSFALPYFFWPSVDAAGQPTTAGIANRWQSGLFGYAAGILGQAATDTASTIEASPTVRALTTWQYLGYPGIIKFLKQMAVRLNKAGQTLVGATFRANAETDSLVERTSAAPSWAAGTAPTLPTAIADYVQPIGGTQLGALGTAAISGNGDRLRIGVQWTHSGEPTGKGISLDSLIARFTLGRPWK